MKKECSKCKEFKNLDCFYNNKQSRDGKRPECIKCTKEKRDCEEYRQRRRENQNSEKYKKYRDNYREKNREMEKKRQQEYLSRPEVSRKRKEYFQRDDVKKRRNEYEKERNKNPKWRISSTISIRINKTLKREGISKRKRHWENLVGYTKEDLKVHLEKLFQEGMTWENYGSDWHIDHIKPISSFDITSLECEEFKKCWALDNLQPLWAKENMKKGNRY